MLEDHYLHEERTPEITPQTHHPCLPCLLTSPEVTRTKQIITRNVGNNPKYGGLHLLKPSSVTVASSRHE